MGGFSASVQSNGSLAGTHESTGQDGPGEKLKEQPGQRMLVYPPEAPYREETNRSVDVHFQGRFICLYAAVSMSVVRVHASRMRNRAALERGRFGLHF